MSIMHQTHQVMVFLLQSPVWTGLWAGFHTIAQCLKGWESGAESVLLEVEVGLFHPPLKR